MRVNLAFLVLLALDALLLCGIIGEVSISYKEAYGFFHSSDFVFWFANFGAKIFGQNDFGLRLPFLCIHLCNLSLIFILCKNYLKKPQDALLCAFIYALIPGINLTSILVSKSVLIIFYALLLCYLHIKKYKPLFFILCALGGFFDFSFSVIYLALFFYAFRFKYNKTLIFALIGFSINMYYFTPPIGGIPRGYFLDTIGLLALLYSPLLFVYYVSALYRGIAKKEESLMLYIASTSILFSLLLSLRQEIDFFSFLPLSAVGLPVMIKDFLHGVRLRLKPFQKNYIRRFYFVLIPLMFEACILFGNKFLFFFEPKRHFLENFYFAKELATELKNQGITSVYTNHKLQNQLKFYGISLSQTPKLQRNKNGEIQIKYWDKKVSAYHLKK